MNNFKVEEEAKQHGDILQVADLHFIWMFSYVNITNRIAGWLWRRVPQTCSQVHECFSLVRKIPFDLRDVKVGQLYAKQQLKQWTWPQIYTLAIQVQDCLSIDTVAAQDRRWHREQHVVFVGVVDQLGEREGDVDDCLLVQEWPSSPGWQLGWVTKEVAGGFNTCISSLRDPNLSKWDYVRLMQVTFEEYPEVSYPTNCHGTFYLFSGQVRNKLLEVKYFISYENPHHTPCTAGFCGTGGENFQDRRRLCHRDSCKRGGRNNTQVEMSQLIFIEKLFAEFITHQAGEWNGWYLCWSE